jgi:tRNA G26 N,N-dimethylase Trm1
MSEEEQIRKLKEVGLRSLVTTAKIEAIDALSAYGEKGITAIAEIANNSIVTEVREHALQTIYKVKEESLRESKGANRRI